jgi:hypothetical protein
LPVLAIPGFSVLAVPVAGWSLAVCFTSEFVIEGDICSGSISAGLAVDDVGVWLVDAVVEGYCNPAVVDFVGNGSTYEDFVFADDVAGGLYAEVVYSVAGVAGGYYVH